MQEEQRVLRARLTPLRNHLPVEEVVCARRAGGDVLLDQPAQVDGGGAAPRALDPLTLGVIG